MDNREKLRQEFLENLKELQEQNDIPQQEIDRVILDYDGVAEFLEDEGALKRYGGQLVDMTAYRAGAIPSSPYDDNNVIPSVTDEEIEMATKDFQNEETSKADTNFIETEDGIRVEGELVDEISPLDKEFQGIMNNELNTHWWRWEDSWDDEAKDYMERYTTGDLTEQEMQELMDDQERSADIDNKIADARQQYEAELEQTANSAGITDTKAFKTLVQAGTKILQAIDEELLYSPLLLAEKGLKKLGLGLAGTAVGGLTRAALVYEDFLFKANVGLAALAHGSLAAQGTASRLPTDIANGIAGLYGAGMPQEIIPQAEGGMSKEEQAKRHQTYFANQMYQYSRMSPSFRLFTDVIGPKTGISDPIQGWQKFGKMLGGDS
ncbi:MAG: hypothetical protein CL508_05665 [Actinobacteria bacterium]|nr:hypothetical protein [Actinomycetota bacterium]|tara:strand:- start:1363 stop:2499 length:1137 start_codon:yes stop_codon:yes gene_type:complete